MTPKQQLDNIFKHLYPIGITKEEQKKEIERIRTMLLKTVEEYKLKNNKSRISS